MKKRTKTYVLLTLLYLCFQTWLTPLAAQQNQKVVLATPNGFEYSSGSFVRPTSDGGYIALGTAGYGVGSVGYELPRVVKMDAGLQTEWDNTYIDPSVGPNGIYTELLSPTLELTDGGFAFGMIDTASGFDVIRLAPTGELLWGKDLPGWENRVIPLQALPSGGFLATRSHLPGPAGWKSYIARFDAAGNLTEEHQIEEVSYIAQSILLSNGDILTATQVSQVNYVFTRVDAAGNTLWQSTPAPGLSTMVAAMPGGGFGVLSRISQSNFTVRFFDAQGNQTGQTPTLLLPINQILSLEFYPDGTFLIGGHTITGKGFMARVQQDGTVVWSAESPEDGQVHVQDLAAYPTADGWGIGTGNTGFPGSQLGLLRVSENSGIVVSYLSGRVFYDIDENCLSDVSEPGIAYANVKATNGGFEFNAFSDADGNYQMIVPPGNYALTVEPLDLQFDLCPSTALNVFVPANVNVNVVTDFPLQSLQPVHRLKGTLWLDQNDNCMADAGDIILKHWRVELKDATGDVISSTFTDVNGEYSFSVPSGNYTVEAIPYNQNFSICAPVSQSIGFVDGLPQTGVLDFTVHPETDCAQMRISMNAIAPMRVCAQRSLNVYYRNDGAAPAEDVTLDVTIPAGLHYVSATPAPASVAGNALHFELGQVLPSPGDIWTSVDIQVFVNCDTLQIGDVVCVDASITPAEICEDAWNGAILTIEGECSGNDAVFTVRNIGNAPSSGSSNIIISEDQIVLLNEVVPVLVPFVGQESYTVTPTMDTVSIVGSIAQEAGFPGDDPIVFTLTNCVGLGGTPTGLGGNAGPFSLTHCIEVVNSYDPNDKSAFPPGYGDEHLIEPGTPLDYTIRFQNTGNDTAYLVVIRDTLSQHFNTARLEVMGATHPFEYALLKDSILHFTFNNIMLPDSTTNRAASEGAVHFRAYPKAGLPLGTIVDNHAAIYFDYNKPIITNTVRRKYDRYVIVKTDDPVLPQSIAVNVYPNPFSVQTTFELPADAPAGAYALDLFDAAGRRLPSALFNDRRCIVEKSTLPGGLLFWKISREGQIVASGKMIAE